MLIICKPERCCPLNCYDIKLVSNVIMKIYNFQKKMYKRQAKDSFEIHQIG